MRVTTDENGEEVMEMTESLHLKQCDGIEDFGVMEGGLAIVFSYFHALMLHALNRTTVSEPIPNDV